MGGAGSGAAGTQPPGRAGPGCQGAVRGRQPPPGGSQRRPLCPSPRGRVAGSDPGWQPRSHPGRREVRLAPWLQVLHLRPLVVAALTVPDTVSWHAPVGEDGAILGDFIEGDEPDGPMVDADLDGIANLLREAVARLPAREARIVTLRYGLADGQPRRLADIGAELGLTSERIRQLERRAPCTLRP